MTLIAKRSFLAGLASLLGAPAIVHAGNIMPVKRPELGLPALALPHTVFFLPSEVVIRLGGGDFGAGHSMLERWVAGVRDVIESERRAQADLREVLDHTNRLGGWGFAYIDGDVKLG